MGEQTPHARTHRIRRRAGGRAAVGRGLPRQRLAACWCAHPRWRRPPGRPPAAQSLRRPWLLRERGFEGGALARLCACCRSLVWVPRWWVCAPRPQISHSAAPPSCWQGQHDAQHAGAKRAPDGTSRKIVDIQQLQGSAAACKLLDPQAHHAMASPGLCRAPEAACRTAWAPSRRPISRRASGVACGTQADARRQPRTAAAATGPEQQALASSSSSSTRGSTASSSSSSSDLAWQQELPRRAVGLLAAAAVAAAGVLGPAAAPPPAGAVTQEQLLYLEAWRAVDRAYVDKKFNGLNWFKVWMRGGWALGKWQLDACCKCAAVVCFARLAEFVRAGEAGVQPRMIPLLFTAHPTPLQPHPTQTQVREDALKKAPLNNREETHAAIRSMLDSLGDPFTRFLVPDQYAALRCTHALCVIHTPAIGASWACVDGSAVHARAAHAGPPPDQRAGVPLPRPQAQHVRGGGDGRGSGGVFPLGTPGRRHRRQGLYHQRQRGGATGGHCPGARRPRRQGRHPARRRDCGD